MRLTRLSQIDSLAREEGLERIRKRHISTFDLISKAEYEAGLARAERELPERIDYRVEWLVAVRSSRVRSSVAERRARGARRAGRDARHVPRRSDEPAAWRGLGAARSGWWGFTARKFFGTFDPSTGEYRVCAQIREGDDPAALGLETTMIPGGTYLRARLRGDPPDGLRADRARRSTR